MSIAIENLCFAYPTATGSIPALQNVTLRVESSEFVGIMGQTGCGKTTLFQLIAGLLRPQSGRVLIDGNDINAKDYPRQTLRQTVGVVFQYPECQLFETTVEKDVAFGLKRSGLPKAEVRQRVQTALETMGFCFADIRSQSPLALSGGEKRRVAIAGVLATHPRILIFDEPVAGLDPLSRTSFLQLATRLNQSGVTILMISHNADALAECANRLVVMQNGSIALDGSVAEVFANPAEMERLQVGVSSPRRIAALLAQKGIVLGDDITRYDQLLAASIARFAPKGGDAT